MTNILFFTVQQSVNVLLNVEKDNALADASGQPLPYKKGPDYFQVKPLLTYIVKDIFPEFHSSFESFRVFFLGL